MNRKAKQNRSPNSVMSGGSALGSTSRRMIHHRDSPRSRATSTKSITAMFRPTARDRRKTRVESSTAMVRISTGIDVPITDRMMSAKMSWGIAIRASTKRLRSVSSQPPRTAAAKPALIPMAKERSVMRKAIPMVVRAP